MYKLKQSPEDFIVEEISKVTIQNGPYSYYLLKKENRNTLDVVKEIAKRLKIKEKSIGFAGSKDRNAITSQIISLLKVKKEKVIDLDLKGVELSFLGTGKNPISLGDLKGNKFMITIRNIEKEPKKIKFVENYFDEQRFSMNNKDIGKFLVKKDFKFAVAMIDNYQVQDHLKNKPNDYIGALKRLSLRLLKMYVHAYQSYLFNECLKEFLEYGKTVDYSLGEFVFTKDKQNKDLELPLIGFASEELENEENKEIIKIIMQKEGINYNDFIIRQIPELSCEGELRECFVEVKDLIINELEEDELNQNMKKIMVSFTLPKGSYATMVIRKMFAFS